MSNSNEIRKMTEQEAQEIMNLFYEALLEERELELNERELELNERELDKNKRELDKNFTIAEPIIEATVIATEIRPRWSFFRFFRF
jgi:hypothetical protein